MIIKLLKAFVLWFVMMAVVFCAVDSYEFEVTGKCQDCVILKGYFEGRNNG